MNHGEQKIRVGIVFGGPSAEHEVSCSSALAVVRALPRERFDPVVLGITRDAEFRLISDTEVERLRTPPTGARAIDDRLTVNGVPVVLRPLRVRPGAAVVTADAAATAVHELDVVFPVLHGPFGEDGVLQGFLETLGVPYVGCGVTGSAVGMDKVAMKRAFLAESVPITPHVWINEEQWRSGTGCLSRFDHLTRPLFVKPANMGSSIGISRAVTDEELIQAVETALRYDPVVLIEQGVPAARELECGVLGGLQATASVVGEVAVAGGWFDYQQKYFGDTDPMTVPAHLPDHVAKAIQELSVRAFRAVGGWGLARVDFLYDTASDRIYVNELNTMPGFTAHSMYPKVWAASGVPYPALLARLIDLAFQRHARRRDPRGAA